MENDLIITYIGKLQVIQFNRPKKRNAFSEQIYRDIPKALSSAAKNDDVSISILTGTGEYFSSGNDLSQLMAGGVESDNFSDLLKHKLQLVQNFINALIEYPKVLVAVVNGPAIGIAVTMLGLCDIVYAADNATFQTPFTSLGITAEGCSTYTFPRILGSSMAGHMLYLNHVLTSNEARQLGFVSSIFTKGTSKKIIDQLVELAELPSKSLIYTKRMVRSQEERNRLREINQMEIERLNERFGSEECMEAIVRFLSRKKTISKL